MKHNETALKRVKQYVNSTNSILTQNLLKVSASYRIVEDVRCVEIVLDGNLILGARIELLCDHTDTSFFAFALTDSGKPCILLTERKDVEI